MLKYVTDFQKITSGEIVEMWNMSPSHLNWFYDRMFVVLAIKTHEKSLQSIKLYQIFRAWPKITIYKRFITKLCFFIYRCDMILKVNRQYWKICLTVKYQKYVTGSSRHPFFHICYGFSAIFSGKFLYVTRSIFWPSLERWH